MKQPETETSYKVQRQNRIGKQDSDSPATRNNTPSMLKYFGTRYYYYYLSHPYRGRLPHLPICCGTTLLELPLAKAWQGPSKGQMQRGERSSRRRPSHPGAKLCLAS